MVYEANMCAYIESDLQPSLYPYCAGVPPTPTTVSAEHDYAKGTSNRPLAPMKPTPGYSTLAIMGGKDNCVRLEPVEESSSATTSTTASTSTSSTTCTGVGFGQSVSLLSSTYKVVGTGLIMDGTTLHGHAVPKGFTKVAIQKITTGVKPWPALKDDSEDLSDGSITAWPLKFVRNVKL